MEKSKYLGNKGQAAALDLAIFVSICVLSLSYLFIQSAKTSSATMYVQENENINEVAIKAIDALAQSSGGELELKTVQPVALDHVKAGFAEDIRTILKYAEMGIEKLDELEREARYGDDISLSSPHLTYVNGRMDDISAYLFKAKDLVEGVVTDWLDEAASNMGVPCDALSSLSQMLPGYGGVDGSCFAGIGSYFLDELVGSILDAEGIVSEFNSALERELKKLESLARDALADALRELRCELTHIRDTANSLLTYLETGLNLEVSFLELWPVDAKIEGMTLEQMLGDSMIVGDNFVSADDLRSVAAAAGLLLLRNREVDADLDVEDDGDLERVEGSKNMTEDVVLVPEPPLQTATNASAEGPYHELEFGVETYITQSSRLGVRLKVWGDGLGGVKQKSNYFEGMDYILEMPSYPTSKHYRTYNGSFVKGGVEEDLITQTTKNWTEGRNLSKEITALSTFKEIRLLRPMNARINLTYGNLTWADQTYGFDIEHFRIIEESEYFVNTSKKDNCSDCNMSDAFKSIILGILLSDRTDLMDRVAEAVENRLDELLKGYDFKFEVRDSCGVVLEINADEVPIGRGGVAKYYFMGDGSRAEMKLTVWR